MAHKLDTLEPGRGGRRTRIVDQVLDSLAPDDLQPVLRALRDEERVSHRRLAVWLTEQGHTISDSAIYHYRNRRWLDEYLTSRGIEITDA